MRTEAVSGSACVAGSRWTVMYTEARGGPARRLTGGAASLVCSWLAPATRDAPRRNALGNWAGCIERKGLNGRLKVCPGLKSPWNGSAKPALLTLHQ